MRILNSSFGIDCFQRGEKVEKKKKVFQAANHAAAELKRDPQEYTVTNPETSGAHHQG